MLRNLFYVLLATLVFFIAMTLFPLIAVGYILLLGYAITKGNMMKWASYSWGVHFLFHSSLIQGVEISETLDSRRNS